MKPPVMPSLFDLDQVQRQCILDGTIRARSGRDIGQQQPLLDGIPARIHETTPTEAALEGLTYQMQEGKR